MPAISVGHQELLNQNSSQSDLDEGRVSNPKEDPVGQIGQDNSNTGDDQVNIEVDSNTDLPQEYF